MCTRNYCIPDKVSLFLTDGKPTDTADEIHDTIRSKNAMFQNRVVIMTFGLESQLLNCLGSQALTAFLSFTFRRC
jgi:hypothetical protein